MQIGMVGLVRMGGNRRRRRMKGGHECVVYDLRGQDVATLVKDGAMSARSLEELVHTLSAPRAVWIMVPSGTPTEDTVGALSPLLQPADAMIDGGNSFYKDDVRRSTMLTSLGIDYLDVGTSGGVWGLERGYCLMIGGSRKTVERLDPIFEALDPGPGDIPRTPTREGRQGTAEQGYLYVGASGAGHVVKMIHNGIEYGLMQAYAEGFEILRGANAEHLPNGLSYDLELADTAAVWRRGSVTSSWLLDLTSDALASDGDLATLSKIPTKAAGRLPRRWKKAAPPTRSRSHSSPGFGLARSTRLRRRLCRRCGRVSVAIWKGRQRIQ